MHPVIQYILLLLVVAAIGMAIANRKVDSARRKQRWFKYFSYIIVTGFILVSIFYDFFPFVAIMIVMASVLELGKVSSGIRKRLPGQFWLAIGVFILAAAGFILFSFALTGMFILFIYFQVIVFDGFCQITGQLFGKVQLAPGISPSKTIEGLIGGILFCCLAAMLGASWLEFSPGHALLFGICTALFSFLGDLIASLYKRKLNIKDYSNWIPGQGGFLDRFDSFLLSGAIYSVIWLFIFKK